MYSVCFSASRLSHQVPRCGSDPFCSNGHPVFPTGRLEYNQTIPVQICFGPRVFALYSRYKYAHNVVPWSSGGGHSGDDDDAFPLPLLSCVCPPASTEETQRLSLPGVGGGVCTDTKKLAREGGPSTLSTQRMGPGGRD